MPRIDSGPRFFTVKVWNDWVPRFGPVRDVELCVLLVRAGDADEARRRAFDDERRSDGLEVERDGAPVQLRARGVDAVYDTGRTSLADFEDDPVVFSQLHEVDGDGRISLYEQERIAPPAPADLAPEETDDLPDDLDRVRDGERWFGVKLWRAWSVGDDEPKVLEELVLTVRASSPGDARQRATALALAADGDVVNDRGELVHVRTVNVDYVYDSHSATVVTLEDREVFGQLFELNPDGSVEFFDPDNDLPFREGVLKEV